MKDPSYPSVGGLLLGTEGAPVPKFLVLCALKSKPNMIASKHIG